MMDGAQINVDVTAPGATIALALIFLKVKLFNKKFHQNLVCSLIIVLCPHI